MRGKKLFYILLACMLMLMLVPSVTWAATGSGNKISTTKKKTVQKTITIETSKGTIKKNVNVGSYITLPTDINKNGYTFLGWSTINRQTSNPMYQAYEKIKITKNIHLYPVKYKWSQEPDIRVDRLAKNVEKYDKIIFVGDSRTVMLKGTLQRQCSDEIFNKVGFVCKSGEGLKWMKVYGEKLLLDEVDAVSGPVAVIFNLGVNDLIHKGRRKSIDYDAVAAKYASYMNKLAEKLNSRNCELFYMSVNPCNTAMKATRNESEIRGFNSKLKYRLRSNFVWIDTYSYFMRYGYTTLCEFRGYTDDGVHYSMKTYKRIYAYAMKRIR